MRFAPLQTMVLAAGLALSAGSASAAIISGTYGVTGSNFSSTSAAPFASITERFTISFDNAVTVSQQTTGITLGTSTIVPTSTLAFTYIPQGDTLIVGGTAQTVATSDPGSTDFALVLRNASDLSNYSITTLSYSVGTGAVYTALTTAKAAPVAAVPEPASLALLGGAIATIGFIRRRKSA